MWCFSLMEEERTNRGNDLGFVCYRKPIEISPLLTGEIFAFPGNDYHQAWADLGLVLNIFPTSYRRTLAPTGKSEGIYPVNCGVKKKNIGGLGLNRPPLGAGARRCHCTR